MPINNRRFPNNFSSYEEYIGYFDCIMRAELGSKALVYTDAYGANANIRTSKTLELVVVGKTKASLRIIEGTRHLLLSAPKDQSPFPRFLYKFTNGSMASNYSGTYDMVANIRDYSHFYKSHPNDIRIAEIIGP